MSTLLGLYRMFRGWGAGRWTAVVSAVRTIHTAWRLDRHYRENP